MNISENKYFERLKEMIVIKMKQTYPGIPNSISDWKGQNIIDFQTELWVSQKEQISEKWFYMHMKSNNQKLPRIDILIFLSKYIGYINWDDFKQKNILHESKNGTIQDKSNRVFYLVPILLVGVLFIFYLIFTAMYTQEYTFCFYDSDTKDVINNSITEIAVISNNESPVYYLCNNNGCFTIKTKERILKFIVENPYYHTDTIKRTLNKFNRTENVKLKIDDYAIMIQYFSNSNVKDWLNRRENLDKMFSDTVKIFQVMNGTVGMEIYNKWEFINKLTLPTNSLRDIEIIDTKYSGEKITHLRFIQNEESK